jgi:tetratricopeptide (TPR) repeat protein
MAIQFANGYRDLGMYKDALAVLNSLDLDVRTLKDVRVMKVAIYTDMANWKALAIESGGLRKEFPNEISWWVQEAYAIRRLKKDGIQAARELLLKAEELFPKEAIVKYNLGCYACILGNNPEAFLYVRKAIDLDSSYLKIAMTDEDLEGIWKSLA